MAGESTAGIAVAGEACADAEKPAAEAAVAEDKPAKAVTFAPAPREAEVQQKPLLRTGQRILLKGLKKGELNGHRGVIIKWKADVGRYAVRIAGKEMAIKPENIQTEGGAAEAMKWQDKHRNIKGAMYNPVLAYSNVPGQGPKMTQWVGQVKAGTRIVVKAEQSGFEDEPVPLWFGDNGFVRTAPVDVALLITDVGADAAEWPKALRRLLDRFPVIAGRLRPVRKNDGNGWQILLNNAGVPFTSASVAPCSLPQSAEELQRLAADEKSGFFDIGDEFDRDDLPLLRLKLIVEDGTSRGLLGLSFNHALCDIFGIGLLLRWFHHELDNTEPAPEMQPCNDRKLAEETLKAVPEASPEEAEAHQKHWPLHPRSLERWSFLARRIRAGCRGPHDGVATLTFTVSGANMQAIKAEAVEDGAASASAFEALVCYIGLKLLQLGRRGQRCLITKDFRAALEAAAPGNQLQALFSNAVTHGLSFELPGGLQEERQSMPLAEACQSMRNAIDAASLGYIAWQKDQDHFRGLPNFFSGLCCNSWGRALADSKLVEAYAIGMRGIAERAANMAFPLDTAYMQVLPQPCGDHTVLLTMPLREITAFMKELPQSHFSLPHVSEILVHAFKVPLPIGLMNRLNPLVEDCSKTVRIACIGDSITACGYPKYLQAMFDKADLRVHVRNFGITGATVQKFSDKPYWDEKKKEDARQWRPHFVISTFGTNDAKESNWDLTAFEQDYKMLVHEFLCCIQPRPVVFLATPPPCYEDGSLDIKQEAVNKELPASIARIAEAVESEQMGPLRAEAARCRMEVPEEYLVHISTVDIFSSMGGTELRRRGYFAEDGVHPNERGTKLLTHVVYSHLCRDVKKTLAKWADAPKVVENDGGMGL